MSLKVDPDWWKSLFDEVYLLTDARSVCDDSITRQEVDILCGILPIRSGQRILDLCGGHGRHSIELCSRGMGECIVMDYSVRLLAVAMAAARARNLQIQCIQSDARSIGLSDHCFDHVLIMGNSLGYIPEADADEAILEESKRVLRPGGWLLVDVTDGSKVEQAFSPKAWHEASADIVVCRERVLEGGTVCAREMVLSKREGLIRDRTYCMRLYHAETLKRLLEKIGFRDVRVHGNFSPHRFEGDYGLMKARLIAVGRKPRRQAAAGTAA
jgi:D-alanine-D-alanine ligase